MPSLPRLRIGPLADVAARAVAMAADPARAMLERAEALADRVDPEKLYPLAGVLADLRGDRSAASARDEDDSSVVGAALLADLPSLVEHLSTAARLDPRDYKGPGWLDAAAVCKRWGVSRSTLDRYRKRGLIGRRIEPRAGRPKLVFASGRVEAFEARHRPGLERAGSFRRISSAEATRMLRRAARYRRVFGWSPSRAAERIAERFGRSHEAVRQLLLRRGISEAGELPAPAAPPVHAREREIIARAARVGVPVERLAERFDRSEGSIYRSLILAHAERLIALRPEPAPWEDAAERLSAPDGPRVFLDHAAVQTNLGRPAPSTLAALLALVEADEPITPGVERELARAHAFLRHRAAALIATLPRHNPPRTVAGGVDAALAPGAGKDGQAGVDEIETILRWAARLKAELVRSQLPLAVRTIEGAIERPVASLTPAQVAGAFELAVGTLSEAVERHDPFRAGRIAAQAGLALNRTVAAWWRSTHAPAGRPGAARARSTPPELVAIADFTISLCPWQRDLDLAPRLRGVLPLADDAGRTLLARRMGWQVPLPDGTTIGGAPPRSLAQIAAETGKPVWRIARLEGNSVRALLAAARGIAPKGAA